MTNPVRETVDEARKRSIVPWWDAADPQEIDLAKRLATLALGGRADIETLMYRPGSGNEWTTPEGPMMPLQFDQYWGVRPYWATYLETAKIVIAAKKNGDI